MLTISHQNIIKFSIVVFGLCLGSTSHAAVMVDYNSGSNTWTVSGAEADWTAADGTGSLNGEPGTSVGDGLAIFGLDGSNEGNIFSDATGNTTDRFDADSDLISVGFSGDVTWGGLTGDTTPGVNGTFYVFSNGSGNWDVMNAPLVGASLAGFTLTGVGGTTDTFTFDAVTTSGVPEPSSFVLLGLCCAGLVYRKRRNAQNQTP